MANATPAWAWQSVADTIADELTQAQIEELCRRMRLSYADMARDSRQETADQIARTLADDGQLENLIATMLIVNRDLQDDADAGQSAAQPGTLSSGKELNAERVVNTGFVTQGDPDNDPNKRDNDFPLYTNEDYYFWLNIGALLEGSIETKSIDLDTGELPVGSRFKVALYGFENELILDDTQDIGELILQEDGRITVSKPVAQPTVSADKQTDWLFFPIRTAGTEGEQRLRCNIYYKQILLQSRLVTVLTSDDPEPSKHVVARKSELDYVISKTLTYQLDKMPEHRLSIMINDNDDSTHGFRFFGNKGGDDFKNDSNFDAAELTDLITWARGSLRKAAWGDEGEFKGQNYRYAHGQIKVDQLRIDLFRCAKRGYRIYDTLINRLAGDADKAWDLADLMLTPGQVQIASKASARLILPTALIYDYPLDTSLGSKQLNLCPDFVSALQSKTPLETTSCFQGECPSAGKDDHVCPSGFWGYRHMIGMPVTTPNGPDAPVEIKIEGQREISMAVSTDPNFIGREKHQNAIKGLHPQLTFNFADERAETMGEMKSTSPQVLYFFCHGIFSGRITYIQVGPPKSRGISRDQLRQKRIRWRKTRPLVFINGCHTAALNPDRAMDLVGGFIDTSHAAGVIGTEITNFVPVAITFGEECLERFMVKGQTIGEAVRGARLAVLQQGNPLGLIYVPYVMTGLKMVE